MIKIDDLKTIISEECFNDLEYFYDISKNKLLKIFNASDVVGQDPKNLKKVYLRIEKINNKYFCFYLSMDVYENNKEYIVHKEEVKFKFSK